MKGFIIAGTHSGVGKTTITLGLMSVLRKKGLSVQPFKAGPDYIDTSFHRTACGRPSYNLDTWMMGIKGVTNTFRYAGIGADISIIEGAMGLFDGKYEEKDYGSTAHIAKVLGLPVILVIDAKAMAQSAGAVVYGFERFDKDINIAGVIFNRVGSERHFKMLKEGVEKKCKAKVLGYIPKDKEIELPERHLGLVMMQGSRRVPSGRGQGSRFIKIENMIERFVDVDGLMRLLRLRLAMTDKETRSDKGVIARALARSNLNLKSVIVKIAIAYDNAFCFYYQENLDILKELGAEIIFFSPLNDKKLPEKINGIHLGGGYPELFAKKLSANKSLIKQIKDFAEKGLPIYAECGGLMYLGRGLKNFKGKKYEMVGVFPWVSRMLEKRKSMGYREIKASLGCPFLAKGKRIRGHEFHYSEIDKPSQKIRRVYRITHHASRTPLSGGITAFEGYLYKNTLASYIHLHFASNPLFAKGFVEKCIESTNSTQRHK